MSAGWIAQGADTPAPVGPDVPKDPWTPTGPDTASTPALARPHQDPGAHPVHNSLSLAQRGKELLFGHEPESPHAADQHYTTGILPSVGDSVGNSVDKLLSGPDASTLASAYPHLLSAQAQKLKAGYQETYGAGQVQNAERQVAGYNVLPQVAARIPGTDAGAKIDAMAADPLVAKTARSLGLSPQEFAGDWAQYAGLSPEQQADNAARAKDTLEQGRANVTAGRGSRNQAWADERVWQPSDLKNGKLDPWSLKGIAFNTALAIPELAATVGATVAGTAVGGPGVGMAAGGATAVALFAPAQREDAKNKIDDQVGRILEKADALDDAAPVGGKRGLNPVTEHLRQQAADLAASSDKIANTAGFLYAVGDAAGAVPVSAVLSKSPAGKAVLDRIVGAAAGKTVGGRIAGAMVANGAGGLLQASLQKAVDTGIVHEETTLKDALADIAYAGLTAAITAAPIAGVHEALGAPGRAKARRDLDSDELLNRVKAASDALGGAQHVPGEEYPGYKWNEGTHRYEPTANSPNAPPARRIAGAVARGGAPAGGNDGPAPEAPAGAPGKREAYQSKMQTLNAAAAAAEKRSDVTLEPEEEGWSIHVKGEPVAQFDTVEAAREAMAQARKLVGTQPAAQTPTQPTDITGIKPGNNPVTTGDKSPTPETELERTQPIDVTPERRTATELRQRVTDMTPEQMKAALLTHELTGIPNRRAYEDSPKKAAQASVDVDSLKWINDHSSHAGGDQLLKAVAQALHEESGGNAYHLSGDEFVVQGDSHAHADAIMMRAKDRLARAVLTFKHPDGRTVELTGVGLSHGTGNTLAEADHTLQQVKGSRQAQGVRSARGEQPPNARVTSGEAGLPAGGRAPAEKATEIIGQKVRPPAQPTPAQAEAGNYFKPQVAWHGLPIKVENTKGSYRRYLDAKTGKPGKRQMRADYGYFPGTKGADADGIDVMMGPHHESDKAFVIDQLDHTGKTFDEHKVQVGVRNEAEAREQYLSHYPKNWKGLGAITELNAAQLKRWLAKGDLTQPIDPESVPAAKVQRGPAPDARHDSILQYLARHPLGLDRQEAESQGVDKADMALSAAHVGIKRAFRRGGMSFDHAAETLHQAGYPVTDAQGHYSPNVLLDRLDDELRGRRHFSVHNAAHLPEGAHAPDWRQPLSDEELDKLSIDETRARIARLEQERERLEREIERAGLNESSEHETEEELDRIPFQRRPGVQQDLFGAVDHVKNELKRLEEALDKKRNSGQESVETGRPDDLFSQARKQTDLTDKPAIPPSVKAVPVSGDRPTTLYRGTETGTAGVKRESSGGEIGRAIYATPHRWLAESYGGGPKAKPGAGRDVHELTLPKLPPEQYGYIVGGSIIGEKAQLVDHTGKVLHEYEGAKMSGAAERDAIRGIADAAGIKVIVGDPESIAHNQVAILDPALIAHRTVTAEAKPKTGALEDAGEKIGGARKDKWAERGMRLSDLSSMTDAEAATLVNKKAVWNPDWKALVEGGMSKDVAALGKILLDQLAARPRLNTPEGRQHYVEILGRVRDMVLEAKDAHGLRGIEGRLVADLGVPTGYSIASTPEQKLARDKFWSIQKGRRSTLRLDHTDLRKAKEMLQAGWPQTEAWGKHFTLVEHHDKQWYLRDKQAKRTDWSTGYPDAAAAVEAARQLTVTREEALAARPKEEAADEGEPKRPHLDVINRIGPPVRTGDVTSTDFIKSFGFRGLEFGNWAASDERQRLLNHAYEGLQDLARILKLPPQALSLNGTMGLALGARGGGRFAAHYEPGRLVINMTKINGAGALAHEWGHALDHYMGELGRRDAYTTDPRGATGWYGDRRDHAHLRPDMQVAWQGVMEAMYKRQVPAAEFIRDHELALERMRSDRTKAEAALRERPADATLLARKDYTDRRVRAAQQFLDELRAKPQESYTGGPTKYMRDAAALGDYWRRPTEMFARAFEAYVFDRIKAEGNQSDYLVQGTEGERHVGNKKGNPYPLEDRAQINAAIQKLIDTFETHGDKSAIREPRADDIFPARHARMDLPKLGEEDTHYALREPQLPRAPTKDVRSASSVRQLDIFANAAAPQPAVQAARLTQSVKLAHVGEFRSGISRVTTWEDAAHILAPLRKQPQENMAALVLDAAGKPLAVIRHSIGQADAAMVEPWSLAGSIVQVPGAAQVYFAHNHPSGFIGQSVPDELITNKLHNLLEGTGIEPRGMIVVGPRRTNASYYQPQRGSVEEPITRASRRALTVPLQERRFGRLGRDIGALTGREFKAPGDAKHAIINLAADGHRSGALLLNNRHQVVGFVPMTPGEMMKLRTGDTAHGAGRLLKAMAEANAGALIAFGPVAAARNVGVFGNAAGVRVLDTMHWGVDGDLQSPAERGQMPEGQAYLQRPGDETRGKRVPISMEEIRRHVDSFIAGFSVKADVVIAKDLAELQADPDIGASLTGLQDGDVTALMHPGTGKIYLVADQFHAPDDVTSAVAHEYITHFGLRAALGDRRNAQYQAILDGVRRALPAEFRQRGEEEFPAGFNPLNAHQRNVAAEETLAYYGQRYARGQSVPERLRRWLDKMHAMLRDWIREVLGLPQKFDELFVKRTLADLEAFLRRGKSRAEPSTESEPAFAGHENTFFSGLAKAVDAAKREKGTGAEWEATLRNMPGVKAEELQWTGLKDWLEGRGRVTKQEVADYVAAHRVQLGETLHASVNWGDLNKILEPHGFSVEENYDGEAVFTNLKDPDSMPDFGELPADIQQQVIDYEGGRKSPKYGSWATPGGTNYRELLMTAAPRADTAKVLAGRKAIFEQWAPRIAEVDQRLDDHLYGRGAAAGIPLEDLQKERDRLTDQRDAEAAATAGEIQPGDLYRSRHWDEPNVLAHVRFDDRTGPKGERILHVHELQSDWHQTGRRSGYKGSPEDLAHQAKLKALGDERSAARAAVIDTMVSHGSKEEDAVAMLHNDIGDHHWLERRQFMPPDIVEAMRRYHATSAAVAEAQRGMVVDQSRVPNAPFKTTWPELAMKRMLRYAAERGYDALSWDTGDTNAERYNMQTVVDSIHVRPAAHADERGNKLYRLTATKDGHRRIDDWMTPEKIASYIGKDMTQKAISQIEGGAEDAYFKGDDLKVGGAGMRAFYDDILPKTVGKLVKKWGSSVEPGQIPPVKDVVALHDNETMDLGRFDGLRHDPNLQLSPELMAQYWAVHEQMGEYGVPYRNAMENHGSPELAARIASVNAPAPFGWESTGDNVIPSQALAVHSVAITPKMRDSVMQGQPMFLKRRKGSSGAPAPVPKKGAYDLARRAIAAIPNNEFVLSLRRIADPAGVSPPAKATALVTREALGELARSSEEALQNLEHYAKAFDLLGTEDRYAFIDAMEGGQPQKNAELQPAADAIRALLDDWRERIRGLGTGALDNFIENYFPHIWQNDRNAKKIFGQIFGRRPLKGPASFLKERTIPTTREGLDAGLTPISTNPLVLAFAKLREMQRFYTGVKLMQRFKDEGLAKFLPSGRLRPDDWAEINDAVGRVRQWSEAEQGFIERGHYIMPVDAARVINNHLSASALRNFLPAQIFRVLSNAANALQLGFSAFHLGFTTLDVIISKNALAIERLLHGEPLKAARALVEANAGLAAGALGGPIPGVVAAVATAGMNIRRGHQLLKAYASTGAVNPQLQRIVEGLMAAGGRVKMDNYFQAARGLSPFKGVGFATLASDVKSALTQPHGKVWAATQVLGSFPLEYATRLWRDLQDVWALEPLKILPIMSALEITGRVVRASTSIIMEHIVPLQKLGVFSDLAADHIRRNPAEDPVAFAAAMQRIWNSVDNRLGEMVYDNVFWHRTFKEVNHMLVRAVGWNLGTIRELGGAPIDVVKLLDYLARGAPPEAEASPLSKTSQARQDYEAQKARLQRIAEKVGHKIPYALALLGTTMILGAALTYLFTGKGPEETKDYFFPPTGRKTKYGTKERISMPSYTKDLYEYGTQPINTLINKANPIFGIAHTIYANEDFFGNAVRDPDAGPWAQVLEGAQYAGRQVQPFAVQGTKQFVGAGEMDTRGKVLSTMPYIGFGPAPARVTSPEQMDRYQLRETEKSYLRGLKRQLKLATDKKDAGEVERLREEIREHRLKERGTEHEIRQDKINSREAGAPALDTSRYALPPGDPAANSANWAPRADGSAKGPGFLGLLKRPDGRVSSEISIGVEIEGREVEVPTLVPTLSQSELDYLMQNPVGEGHPMPPAIVQKAVDFARPRIAAGKSPFAGPADRAHATADKISSLVQGRSRDDAVAALHAAGLPAFAELWGSLPDQPRARVAQSLESYV